MLRMKHLLLILACGALTMSIPAQKLHRAELDVSGIVNPGLREAANTTMYGNPYTMRGVATGGAGLSLSWRLSVRKHLSLVPGLSYLFFTQQSSTTESVYGNYDPPTGPPFYLYDNREVARMNYHTLSPGLGLRWTYKKFNVENGLGAMLVFPCYRRSEMYYQFSARHLDNDTKIGASFFLESYHKIGFDLTARLAAYAGVVLLYGDGLYRNASDLPLYSYDPDLPLIHVMPSLAVKFKL